MADSKLIKQEVNGRVTLPPLVFPDLGYRKNKHIFYLSMFLQIIG
jgi:hypothetical protein